MTIEEALRLAEAWMDEIDGVKGVAQGKKGGEDCISVFVSMKESKGKIPAEFHGFKVDVQESGDFDALPR